MRDRDGGGDDGFQPYYVTPQSVGFPPREGVPEGSDVFSRHFLNSVGSGQRRNASGARFDDFYYYSNKIRHYVTGRPESPDFSDFEL